VFGERCRLSGPQALTTIFLHSLFSERKFTLNGITITQASEKFNYRSYLETLMTYGSNVQASHPSNVYWYRETTDMYPCYPTSVNLTAGTNRGFIISASKEDQNFGRLHSDVCTIPLNLTLGVMLQIRLTKALPSSYVKKKAVDSKITFKFLDAQL